MNNHNEIQRDKSTVSRYIKNIFAEDELQQSATVANFATVQNEGDRKVERQITYRLKKFSNILF